MSRKTVVLVFSLLVSVCTLVVANNVAYARGREHGSRTRADITEFELPNPDSGPGPIKVGPDLNLWFTELNGDRIGRFDLAGYTFTEFPLSSGSQPRALAVGPDNNLWFVEYSGNRVGKITLDGVITEFGLPSPNSGPAGITAGPDGNLWFTELTKKKEQGNETNRYPGSADNRFSLPVCDGRNAKHTG